MNPGLPQPQKGSLILVVMCLLAVLGIALAGYLAVSNQSMKSSNRSYATDVSRHLAEMGLERGLLALNTNDWSSWTNASGGALTSTDTTAYRTISFANTKYGNVGVTGSFKMRVDNYNAAYLNSTWSSSSVSYRINDLVSNGGIWYRCVANHTSSASSQPPNLAYWTETPIPWTWSSGISYSQYDIVNYSGVWYRCITAPPVSAGTTTYAPQLPPATTYWAPIPSMRAWASSTAYSASYDVIYYNGSLYRCITDHTSSASFAADSTNWSSNVQSLSLSWSSGTVYTHGAVVYYSGTWYYCTHWVSSGTNPSADTPNWAVIRNSSGAQPNPGSSTYNIGTDQFNTGDLIYRSGTGWLRCIVTTLPYTYVSGDWSSTTPVKWVNTNNKTDVSWAYRSGATYNFSNVLFYSTSGSGTWYRCKVSSATSVPTTAADWENALTSSWVWSSGVTYNLNDVVYYGSSWYRCLLAHTNQQPPNTTYWATAPKLSGAWDSGRQYSGPSPSPKDTVSYNGVWYLSLQDSNSGNIPSNASSSYWAAAPPSLSAWDSTSVYRPNDVVSSGGVWYRCVTQHSGQAPPNATYWTVLSGADYLWNAATSYTLNSYASYGGVWYKCLSSGSNLTPNNTSYWTASFANSRGVITGAPVIYAEGTATLPDGTAAIKTQLRATVAVAPLFPNAAAATSTLSINGAGTVDSYDSTLGTYASQTPGYSGVLAATGATSPAVTVTSTTVKGYVAAPSSSTTPFAPMWTYGGSASLIGSSSATGVDLTRVSRSPYIPQFDISTVNGAKILTLTSGSNTSIGTPGGRTPIAYSLSSGLALTNTASDILTINGPVILDISGGITINPGKIIITSTGSAEIHFSGALNVADGGIDNQTLDPKKLILIGTATSGTHTFSTTTAFYGVIYMPNNTSALTFGTGHIYGAVSAKNITFSSDANLHYDTSLRYATFGGVNAPFVISQWRELTDPNERAVLP